MAFIVMLALLLVAIPTLSAIGAERNFRRSREGGGDPRPLGSAGD